MAVQLLQTRLQLLYRPAPLQLVAVVESWAGYLVELKLQMLHRPPQQHRGCPALQRLLLRPQASQESL